MQKKKLDELFQDELSDFKQTPDDKVWRAINASLDNKRKKRIIPIWWQIGGIAAVLAIGLLLFYPFSDNPISNEIIVDTETPTEEQKDTSPTSKEETGIDSIDTTEKPLVEKSIEESSNTYAKVDKDVKKQAKSTQNIQVVVKSTHTNESYSKNSKVHNQETLEKTDTNRNTLIAGTGSKNTNNNNHSKEPLPSSETFNKEAGIANKGNFTNQLDSNNLKVTTGVALNEVSNEPLDETDPIKKSLFEEIENRDEPKKQQLISNKWSAGPNIAPVYFNAVGKGSPVNSIFTPNSKSGNINMSYGVSVAYKVSKKLTIRSGINKVDYGYDTEDVAFSSSLNSISSNGQLATIDYAETSNTLTISSNKVTSDKYSTANSAFDVTAKSPTREGYMSQQIGYLELPVELNYALIDNKFGVNIIGGISSLVLIDNAVSLTAGELTTEIGEANNVNDLNFSANMGVGFGYKLSPKIHFNLEPIFKYQLNTFSEINGTFRPYSIGIYSGINYKF
jgi:hypothetical protein